MMWAVSLPNSDAPSPCLGTVYQVLWVGSCEQDKIIGEYSSRHIEEALSVISHTVRGPSFCGLSTDNVFWKVIHVAPLQVLHML
jgi:hypothetical protein